MITRLYRTDADALQDPVLFKCVFDLLPECRRDKIISLRTEKDRCLSAAAGALLLRLCSDEDLSPDMDDLTADPFGRLYFSGHPALHFNISHSGQYAILAAADHPVGCDVEKIDVRTDIDRIAKRFYSPEEYAYLNSVSDKDGDDARRKLFFRYWTLKESFMKVCGLGFQLPLESFLVSFDGNGQPRVRLTDRLPEKFRNRVTDCVRFREPEFEDGYRYALCEEVSGETEPPEIMIVQEDLRCHIIE